MKMETIENENEVVNCLRCGAIIGIRKHINLRRKFCSDVCRTRYHSMKCYYNKLRNNKEYKLKKKECFRRWLSKNREHFNNLMRERSRMYSGRIRKERAEKGLCIRCGRFFVKGTGFKNCEKCRKHMRRWKKKSRNLKAKMKNIQNKTKTRGYKNGE